MAFIDRVKFDGVRDEDWLVYKVANEGLSTATKLIVGEGQVAVFVKGGKATDLFEAGTYTLSTENIPILRRLINLPYGGGTPFTAEIYYINKTSKLNLLWGTKDPIQIVDPKYNIKLRVRAFGRFGIKIENFSKFITEIVGTLGANEVDDYDKVISYFKGVMLVKLKSTIAKEMINNNISALEISANLDSLSETVYDKLDDDFEKFGIKLVNFFIESVNFPDEDFEAVNKILENKAEFDLMGDSRYTQKRSFDVYDKASSNKGGIATAGVNVGVGYAMANNLGGVVDTRVNTNSNIDKNKEKVRGRSCKCGCEISQGAKFCPECGNKVEVSKVICSKCNEANNEGAKFCCNCGNNLTQTTCSKCKQVNKAGAKFCANCGQKLVEG